MDLTERLFDRARKMRLLSQLHDLSGLTRGRVEAIHHGASYTAVEYERLCRAVAVDPVALYRRQESEPIRSPARFRAAMSSGQPSGHDIRLLALATEVGIVLGHLANRLQRASVIPQQRHVVAVDDQSPGQQGYDLGSAARRTLVGHDAPIDSVTGLLRGLGIHVACVDFQSPGIDGASLWTPGALPIILINGTSRRAGHPGALRATLAHELGHLLHDAGEQDLTTIVSWGEHGNYSERIEARARGFAPAFLAPKPAVVEWASSTRFDSDEAFVGALAEHWGLSFEGAAWHAKNCHLLDHADARSLAEMERKPHIDYPCDESLPTHPDSPELAVSPAPLWSGLAHELVCAARREGFISAGRAEELLTWA